MSKRLNDDDYSGSKKAVHWLQYAGLRFRDAFFESLQNRYLLANIVYLGYAIGIVYIDYGLPTDTDIDYINKLYLGFDCIHLISAFMYMWAWKYFSYVHIIMIPEYLNVVEACLYIGSATLYPKEDTDTYADKYTNRVHNIETAAAVISCVASFGWVGTWWMTYYRTIGRGFTLDDPDVFAFLGTLIASIMYVVYNGQVQRYGPDEYFTNYLYTKADILYLTAACFYVFASLRDDGWWWWIPTGGQYITVTHHLPLGEDNKGAYNEEDAELDGEDHELEDEVVIGRLNKHPWKLRKMLLRMGLPRWPRKWNGVHLIKQQIRKLLGRGDGNGSDEEQGQQMSRRPKREGAGQILD
eukprot:TRINITY_DN3006_c0_g1_i1.p1 TRINITY_DN3006_c0_g1~~TRINITY_DN3006_c0_g1_i1.p1  ORF type:complete len:354 (+),score=60.98 TRINITY_DN3006_c0_g1_i1:70-1131(+)